MVPVTRETPLPPKERNRNSSAWPVAAMLWLALCAAAISVAMLGVLSVERERSAVDIENSYAALVVGQTFFLVFLWPLFERRALNGPATHQIAGSLTRLAGLLILSVPFILLALRVSETPAAWVIRSQALLLFIGVAAAAAVRLPGAVAWYYPAAFVLSALVPLAAYLLREEGRVPTAWAAAVSPFRASGGAAAGLEAAAPFIVFGALAAVTLAAVLFFRSRGPQPRAPKEP